MKIPTHYKSLRGAKYDICQEREIIYRGENLGLVNPEIKKIYIKDNICDNNKLSTLIHECLHIELCRANETKIRRLEKVFMHILKQLGEK